MCANYQTHGLVYCKRCGGTFSHECKTVFDALMVGRNRQLREITAPYSPRYIVATFARKYKLTEIEEYDFVEYVAKLGFVQHDYKGKN